MLSYDDSIESCFGNYLINQQRKKMAVSFIKHGNLKTEEKNVYAGFYHHILF